MGDFVLMESAMRLIINDLKLSSSANLTSQIVVSGTSIHGLSVEFRGIDPIHRAIVHLDSLEQG